MSEYRISTKKREWSSTPIVKVTVDDKGKETETPIAIVCLPKKEGDELAKKIVRLLNFDETLLKI